MSRDIRIGLKSDPYDYEDSTPKRVDPEESQWETYRIAVLVSRGWKYEQFNYENLGYGWNKPHVSRNVYRNREGWVQQTMLDLDEAWDAQLEIDKTK